MYTFKSSYNYLRTALTLGAVFNSACDGGGKEIQNNTQLSVQQVLEYNDASSMQTQKNSILQELRDGGIIISAYNLDEKNIQKIIKTKIKKEIIDQQKFKKIAEILGDTSLSADLRIIFQQEILIMILADAVNNKKDVHLSKNIINEYLESQGEQGENVSISNEMLIDFINGIAEVSPFENLNLEDNLRLINPNFKDVKKALALDGLKFVVIEEIDNQMELNEIINLIRSSGSAVKFIFLNPKAGLNFKELIEIAESRLLCLKQNIGNGFSKQCDLNFFIKIESGVGDLKFKYFDENSGLIEEADSIKKIEEVALKRVKSDLERGMQSLPRILESANGDSTHYINSYDYNESYLILFNKSTDSYINNKVAALAYLKTVPHLNEKSHMIEYTYEYRDALNLHVFVSELVGNHNSISSMESLQKGRKNDFIR